MVSPIRLIQLGFNILTPAASWSCADSACDMWQMPVYLSHLSTSRITFLRPAHRVLWVAPFTRSSCIMIQMIWIFEDLPVIVNTDRHRFRCLNAPLSIWILARSDYISFIGWNKKTIFASASTIHGKGWELRPLQPPGFGGTAERCYGTLAENTSTEGSPSSCWIT